MEFETLFLIELSKLMGWEYEVKGTYANFKGYRAWRKQYNQELESVLFSSKKIFDFTKDEFISWLDKLPSQARYRVRNRVLYKEQYPNQKQWFEEWEKFKEKKQEEERILTEKVRQGTASVEDKERLKKVKKEAKVNVGATNFKELYNEICSGKVDSLKLESFMNKVNLPYNSLVIIDDSGSMSGAPFNFATFLASVCLVKNPDDDARNLLGFFSNSTIFKSYIDSQATQVNSLLRRNISQTIHEPLVDPKKSFLDNYLRIDRFCRATFRSGGTKINTIADALRRDPEVIEALKNYPIWTIISD